MVGGEGLGEDLGGPPRRGGKGGGEQADATSVTQACQVLERRSHTVHVVEDHAARAGAVGQHVADAHHDEGGGKIRRHSRRRVGDQCDHAVDMGRGHPLHQVPFLLRVGVGVGDRGGEARRAQPAGHPHRELLLPQVAQRAAHPDRAGPAGGECLGDRVRGVAEPLRDAANAFLGVRGAFQAAQGVRRRRFGQAGLVGDVLQGDSPLCHRASIRAAPLVDCEPVH